MKIPDSPVDRLTFVHEVLDVCKGSQQERQGAYTTLKQYYLYGTETGTSTDTNVFGTVNKIYPAVDRACSMLYSPDSTRFGVEIGRAVSRDELSKCPTLSEAVLDMWQQCEADIRFGEALRWSYVYGSMFLKFRPQGQDIVADIVEPHHVGVYREDLIGLHAQEAFFHEYRIPQSQLKYQLKIAGVENVDQVLAAAIADVGDNQDKVTQPIDRIVTSSALPMAQGEINTYIGSRISYIAKLKQPMVRMYELYIFDDELEDYRVFTCAHPAVPIFDRPIERMFVKHELPMVQVCPFPTHGYFWGMAGVERIMTLQMLRNTRWDQVQHLMELQANPPSFAAGSMMAPGDEIQAAIDSPGGLVLSDVQGSTMQKLAPEMPQDLFAEVNYLDTQFDDAMGTTDTMAGKGEAGVRSEGHAKQLLQVGSSRAKTRALIIERQIEDIATLILKIMQVYSDRSYTADGGLTFTAEQFTDDFMVRVDSHSSSPVFAQDMSQLAFSLFKAKAIDRATLIDLLPVPMRDLLKRILKTKIEPAEQKAAQEQQRLELATGKVSKIGSKK